MDTLNHNMERLTNILYFDPYMQLRLNTLQKIFDEESQTESLSKDLLWDVSQCYEDFVENFHEMLLEGCRG